MLDGAAADSIRFCADRELAACKQITGLYPNRVSSLAFGCRWDGLRLRLRGETVSDELLAHVAPLGWEHIAFNGDYVWPAKILGNAFRPLRNPRAEFLDAA